MVQIDELKFDENGLIPAVVVDAVSRKVLTLAYMNRESLAISMEKGLTCFWSRSRQELWLKGETSGNYQHIVSITADCDRDALVILVEKEGPACHLGTDSCFTAPVYRSEERQAFSLDGLYELLQERNRERPEGSYTTYLFEKGRSSSPARQETKKRRSTSWRILPTTPWCSWCRWAFRWRTCTASLPPATSSTTRSSRRRWYKLSCSGRRQRARQP